MFYDNYLQLCRKKHVSVSAPAAAIGLSRAAVVKWRKGSDPRGETLKALADYFGVTTDQLLDNVAPPPQPEDELIAFYGQVKDCLDDADRADLIAFMRIKAQLKREAKKK